MTRSIFYAFGGCVGSITGPTTVGFWPDDPTLLNWDQSKLVPIDLSRCPQAVRTGTIQVADVQCDDYAGYTFGGFSRLGPMWPGGTMNGIVWVDSGYLNTLGARQPQVAPAGSQYHGYELEMVLYWDGPLANRRFQGLYAEIHNSQGTNALLSIWQAGTSLIPHQNPLGTWWLDLAQYAHPIEPGFTEIGTAPGDKKKGALFLDVGARKVIPFSCPKIPKFTGGVTPPEKRRAR